MKHVIRLFVGTALGLAFAAGTGGAAIPALAGTTIYVNNSTLDDPSTKFCPTFAYTDISTAAAAATSGTTIIVCQGTYTLSSEIVIADVSNVTLKTKGEVHVRPPTNYGNFAMIGVGSSTPFNTNKITVTGFYLDGSQKWAAGSSYMAGIQYYNATGTISKNYISNIDDDYADSNAEGFGIQLYGDDLFDVNSNLIPYQVKVVGNSIYMPKWKGIDVLGNVKPTLTKNNITISSNTGISSSSGTEGIYLENLSAGGTITGNTIRSDFNAQNFFNYNGGWSGGLELYDASKDKISGNSFTGLGTAIYLSDEYANGVDGYSWDTKDNTISSNKATDVLNGVWIVGNYDANSTDIPYVFRNKVSANKMNATGTEYWSLYGVVLDDVGSFCCSLFVDFYGNTNSITGNSFLGFNSWSQIVSTSPAQKFSGNKFGPVPAGAAPAPGAQRSAPPHVSAAAGPSPDGAPPVQNSLQDSLKRKAQDERNRGK
jgi:hypothetical protein